MFVELRKIFGPVAMVTVLILPRLPMSDIMIDIDVPIVIGVIQIVLMPRSCK